jgi:hypothetical protein
MGNVDWSRLVLITVPLRDNKKRIGTGFRVATNRVLTARHNVVDGDGQVEKEIDWELEGLPQVEKPSCRVAWEGGGDFDVAVLEIGGKGLGDVTTVTVRGHSVTTGEECEGKGYARTTARPAAAGKLVRHDDHISGKADAPDLSRPTFRINLTSKALSEELWKGASGAAVFVRGELCGVISIAEEQYAGGVLRAIDLARLLSDPKHAAAFRSAFGCSERWSGLREEVLRALEDHLTPELRKRLAQHLKVVEPEVVPCLARLDHPAALRAMQAVHLAMFKASAPAGAGELLWRLARLRAKLAAPELGFDVLDRARSGIVSLACTTAATVEVQVAAEQDREPEFEAKPEGRQALAGPRAILYPGLEGASGAHEDVYATIDRIARVGWSASDDQPIRDQKLRELRVWLDGAQGLGEYWLLVAGGVLSGKGLDAELAEVKKALRDFPIVRLNGDGEVWERESKALVNPLKNMLQTQRDWNARKGTPNV